MDVKGNGGSGRAKEGTGWVCQVRQVPGGQWQFRESRQGRAGLGKGSREIRVSKGKERGRKGDGKGKEREYEGSIRQCQVRAGNTKGGQARQCKVFPFPSFVLFTPSLPYFAFHIHPLPCLLQPCIAFLTPPCPSLALLTTPVALPFSPIPHLDFSTPFFPEFPFLCLILCWSSLPCLPLSCVPLPFLPNILIPGHPFCRFSDTFVSFPPLHCPALPYSPILLLKLFSPGFFLLACFPYECDFLTYPSLDLPCLSYPIPNILAIPDHPFL